MRVLCTGRRRQTEAGPVELSKDAGRRLLPTRWPASGRDGEHGN